MKRKSAEQQKAINEYLYWQSEYNKSGDASILWNKLRPILSPMIRNCMNKLSKNHFIQDLDWKVERATDQALQRYINKQDYNKDYPLTMAYWLAFSALYRDKYEMMVVGDVLENCMKNAVMEEDDTTKIYEISGNIICFEDKDFYFIKKGEKVDEVVDTLVKNGYSLLD